MAGKLSTIAKQEIKRFFVGFIYNLLDMLCADSLLGGPIRGQYLRWIGLNVEKNVKLARQVKVSHLMKLGEGTFVNYGCYLDGSVTIGKYCLIGYNTNLISTNHTLAYQTGKRRPHLDYNPPIISDYVWIGAGCTVLPGVKIGTGSIIGAGSVVTRDIPDHVIAVGNPCKVLKPLPEESIPKETVSS